MSDAVQQAYLVVSQELNHTVNAARVTLEDAAEGRSSRQALERCSAYLHEIGGVLKVVEVYGGAILCEEMESVCRYMLERGRDPKNLRECMDAMTRAMVQLPAYLERMLAGGRDIALVLLPMLNDLRAVRGQALLSESTILLLNVSPQSNVTLSQRGADPSEDFVALSRKIRPAFQLALLGLLKADKQQASAHLAKLKKMAGEFERAANRDDVYQLWWVIGGVLEALSDGVLEISVSVKRLLGQADRRIKRVIDEGLSSFDEAPVTDLLNNLLYYIARVSEPGPRVSEIRDAFNLSQLLPGEEQVEHAREELAAPSVKLMETVAAAIREDLASVKDVLDIHVRTGSTDLSQLSEQVEMLNKISDTLGVLGLGDLRADVQNEIGSLEQLTKSTDAAGASGALLDIASTLLRVENSLDSKLRQLIRPHDDETPEASGEEDSNFHEVRSAVMRECIVNLARIKETLSQALSGRAERVAIDNTPKLVAGVLSGLSILELGRAHEVFARLGSFFKAYLNSANHTLASEHQDRLADALVSLEYYMETIEAGRKEPEYMLDNAERCLLVLDEVAKMLAKQVDIRPESTMVVEAANFGEAGDYSRTATIADSTEIIRSPAIAAAGMQIDPELLELFIDEAKDEVKVINRLLPNWVDDATDMDSLITVRRSFHTLKGSGRMVGAERIGEFCWHVEDLLNRLINRTLTRTAPMAEFISHACAAIPELIEQLEIGTPTKADIGLLSAKSAAFADGDPRAADMSRESVTSAVDGLEMDPVLLEIFGKEAQGHIATVDTFLSSLDGAAFPASVSDELHRACHTLHGSINTASVERAAPLSGAINQLVRRVYDGGGGLDAEAVGMLQQATSALKQIIGSINTSDNSVEPIDALVRAIGEKTSAIAHEQTALVHEDDAPDRAYEPTEVIASADIDDTVENLALSDEPDFDPDIAEIFTEEAAEVLEAADAALAVWSQSRGQSELTELKRHLHTLKGGANMAGIGAIGNLSHELEALLIALDDKRVEPEVRIDALLRECFDALHQMRDTVITGKRPPRKRDMETRVHMAISGQLDSAQVASDDAPATQRSPLSEDDFVEIPQSSDAATQTMADEGEAENEDDLLDFADVFDKHGETQAGAQSAEAASEVTDTSADVDWFDAGSTLSAEITDQDDSFDDQATIAVDSVPEIEEQSTHVADEETFTSDGFAETLVASVEPDDSTDDEDSEPQIIAPDELFADATTSEDDEVEAEDDFDVEAIDEIAASFAATNKSADLSETPADEVSVVENDEAAQSVPDNVTALPVPGHGLPTREVAREKRDMARVDSKLLENMLNAAGEISIYHGRLAQQVSSIEFHLAELEQTVTRLRDQLRHMEMETEAQILTRHEEERTREDFDPLELDRYSNIQQLSRGLAETSNDVDSLRSLLQTVTGEADTLLTQQSRVTAELQSDLMRTRMIPFDRHVPRLARLVRQSAADTNKQAELAVEGASGELDRQVLEKMLPPLEHMMRNAVVHGIETPSERQAKGKPPAGQITIRLHREGSEMVIDVADDGAGLNIESIRSKGVERGLIDKNARPSDEAIMDLILEPGFTTASQLTQAAGRGVGMDVVANEVKRLGGSLQISSIEGQGTNFAIRLPFTLAITQALVVRAGDEVFALPLPTVEGVTRLPRAEVEKYLSQPDAVLEYGEHSYRVQHLGPLVGGEPGRLPDDESAAVALILVRAGDYSTALLTDEMLASREIVVKSVGPQVASINGVSGATILGDGRVVLILDMPSLVRASHKRREAVGADQLAKQEPLVLVVDDSITVRRVTERLLQRQHFRVLTAKDGLDAVAVLSEHQPDIILLDIEMPRMDGFEFATHVRNDPRVAHTPIIMITSRSGEKHKARAIEIGVNDYLGKPYQDKQLLKAIQNQLDDAARRADDAEG